MNEIDDIVERLAKIEQMFGIGGATVVIILAAFLVVIWKLFVKKIELIAERASEQTLMKFQASLDKELVKFQTKHQKQVDAIHDTFQKFQRMTSTIDNMMNGEKFTQHVSADEEVNYLVKCRHEFKKTYYQNRLLFPSQVCEKIDTLIPTVDIFIETFIDGLFPERSEENIQLNAEANNGLYIAGIWSMGAFTDILAQLKQISEEIEAEFRKIYGMSD
ncbi:hypothetical protein [Sphingobacterium griseoflavum]|uniref:Uncharacterized protein n=1 Tax=Sphingobacterium griseoflavum TaxID=1474952 RepID=A0ABQ3HUU8_9SPHI|nr:hypothetical protein [Sphingobacterium griseoflavum]GHE29114.1 hypothetical protein GCM10017764_09730 [Sphingobacterium griseoflavum]